MPDCLVVDPDQLAERAARLRDLSAEIAPNASSAEHLNDELVAIGADKLVLAAKMFGSGWALALAMMAETLTGVADRLDDAATAYEAYEDLLVQALGAG